MAEEIDALKSALVDLGTINEEGLLRYDMLDKENQRLEK